MLFIAENGTSAELCRVDSGDLMDTVDRALINAIKFSGSQPSIVTIKKASSSQHLSCSRCQWELPELEVPMCLSDAYHSLQQPIPSISLIFRSGHRIQG
jgi:hypothetical protein